MISAVLVACAQVAAGDHTEVAKKPDVGRLMLAFTERSPLSTIAAVTERFRVQPDEPPEDYILADESFWVYVPNEYDGTELYGLMVWVDSGPRGGPPEEYQPVIDSHKLIWIGANNAGNNRSFWHRVGLAMDGLFNIQQRYRIDPMRVYVGGISGGGRCASRIGLIYADHFDGALAINGADFFKRIPQQNDNNPNLLRFWAPDFNPPVPSVMKQAKQHGRYVLLTGENDPNREKMAGIYRSGFKRGRFLYAQYLEAPEQGHSLPTVEWFTKGIEALDEPLEYLRLRRDNDAHQAFLAATDILDRSRRHGLMALKHLVEDFPETSYADQARELIEKNPMPADETTGSVPAETTPTQAQGPRP